MPLPNLTTKSLLLAALLLGALTASAGAQTLSANLSGFVDDPTGAVIPDAQVVLINQASKDKRTTRANSSGFFSFTAVPAGTYTVDIRHAGFGAFVEKDIELHPSDERTIADIKLPVGSVDTTITVNAAASSITNQGEKSVLITADDIKRLPVQGRDVTELIKMLPGFAMTAQSANIGSGAGANNVGPNSDTVGGQTANYTANGASAQGVQIVSDGVNITDPGNGAGSDQVINMDNVAEVKIQTSNFGADSAKGPIVINAVGKSGGSSYHGELYVYGRTYQLNTQDWFSKYDGDAKPDDREVYPGGNVGGPLLIPGTNFNHNHKLTFFVGAEDYVQKNVYAYGSASAATVQALVPTAAMRTGDFSGTSLNGYFGSSNTGGVTASGKLAGCVPGGSLSLYLNICNVPSGTTPSTTNYPVGAPITNGQIPTALFDPGTQAILNHLVPLPNTAPFTAAQGGLTNDNSIFNYKHVNLQDSPSYQSRARIDYAFSDNTKLYVTYNFQHGSSRNPQSIYYSPQDSFGEINTPGGILSHSNSQVGSLNLTRVFTPTLTNEFYAGISANFGGNGPGIKGSNLSSSIGYPYQGIYATNQYPQLDDYGFDGLPLGLFPDYSSPIFQNKLVPSGGDNVTKTVKTHTIKVGVYIERATNNETDLNVASNGQIENYYDGPNNGPGQINGTYARTPPSGATTYQYPTPGNYLASFFLGQVSAFQQYNFQTNSDLYYWTVDSYATDSWKATKQLTLDYGFRLGHVGPWQDAHGLGFAVWDPALYAAQTTVSGGTVSSLNGVVNPGFTWHAIDKAIPNSGAGSTLAFFSPRFGIAYDLYGDGKTSFRGGFGAYRSHDGWNDVNQEQATAQGQTLAIVGGGGIMLRDVPYLASSVAGGNASQSGTNGVGFGLQKGDKEQPLTYTYSFTVDQQIDRTTLFELSYQGSQSKHLLTQYEQGAAGDLANIDALPVGALFKPDPLNGEVNSPQGFSSEGHVNHFRTYPFYTQVNVARHILYANYNALQVSLRKTQGSFLYSFNYTWSKDLGILGSYSTGNVIDSSNIRPNYGPLASDRSHVVNATFSYDTGKVHSASRLASALLSGYDISGIVNLQDGANVQRILGSGFNIQGNVVGASSSTYDTFPINNINLLGTPDVQLQPALTCDPNTNVDHSRHQYINKACFAIPGYGVNGPAEIPYIHGPGYFDFDARLSRNFNLKDKQTLQIQLSGFNVINRANYSFSSKFPSEQTLFYTGTTLGGATAPSDFGYAKFRFGRRVAEISIKYNF